MEHKLSSLGNNNVNTNAPCVAAVRTMTDIAVRVNQMQNFINTAEERTGTIMMHLINASDLSEEIVEHSDRERSASIVVSMIDQQVEVVQQLYDIDCNIGRVNFKLFGVVRDVANEKSDEDILIEANSLEFQMNFYMNRTIELLESINGQLDELTLRLCGLSGKSPECTPLLDNLIDKKWAELEYAHELVDIMLEKLDLVMVRV